MRSNQRHRHRTRPRSRSRSRSRAGNRRHHSPANSRRRVDLISHSAPRPVSLQPQQQLHQNGKESQELKPNSSSPREGEGVEHHTSEAFAREDEDEEDPMEYIARVEKQLHAIEERAADALGEEDFLSKKRKRRKMLIDSMPTKEIQFTNDEVAMRLAHRETPRGSTLSLMDSFTPIEPTQVGAQEITEADDLGFDMFADEPVEVMGATEVGQALLSGPTANASTLADNWDDGEGYYVFCIGDILNQRFRVFANQGKGVFSTVLRVRDLQQGNRELVIKVIRRNDSMRKAGIKEVEFLLQLGDRDPENRKHIVRLLSHFDHRDHLCLVFEPMYLNLRQLLKKFGGVGISLDGVRRYARQLFIALKQLKKLGICHADIKPDNILVNEDMTSVKICDFGSAGRLDDCVITPYLVSRFYRAPEIMLGLPYGCPIDVWSVGCVLFELYTGQILFNGENNNGMLYLILITMGPFPSKLLKRAEYASKHFDENFVFGRKRRDQVTGAMLTRKMKLQRPTRDILRVMQESSGKLDNDNTKKLRMLKDLIDKSLALDSSRRISPDEALRHPFIV